MLSGTVTMEVQKVERNHDIDDPVRFDIELWQPLDQEECPEGESIWFPEEITISVLADVATDIRPGTQLAVTVETIKERTS